MKNTAAIWTGIALAIAGAFVAIFTSVSLAPSQEPASGSPASAFDSATAGITAKDGFLTVYADEKKGRVLVSLPAPHTETGISTQAIHMSYLRTGLGSNPVGLDRGLGSGSTLIRFQIIGDKVLMVAPNTRFVANSPLEAERRAVEESFARSILWSGTVEARGQDGSVLVDLSSFLTKDTIGVAGRLSARGQGSFSQDGGRSLVLAAEALAFPDNIELETLLTFQSSNPGSEVRATAPDANAVSFVLHHSFVRVPDDGYKPRIADPRVGSVAMPIADYAAPLNAEIEKRVVLRHRLEKTDPQAERSPVKEPIIFYVDPGAPEPVRSALIEGASWWAQAYEAAGFEDGYRVEVLPEGAHPLDARYNVIQWVHRQTRGWSYGSPIYDPRTGEIIKAVITLGSLRVRQDRRIFEGLSDARNSGSGDDNDPIQISLARLRQLSAHEVGHGLGFVHNMGASADNRASVMDYPAPYIRADADGSLDFSAAYSVGIGPWDIASLRYSYEQFPDGADEGTRLEAIAAAAARDHVFVGDPHSRPLGGSNPKGSLWDNGNDAVAELENVIAVREAALKDFGLNNIPAGAPVSKLREVLVPVYLYHRYQIEAAGKFIGGTHFKYSVEGGGQEGITPVSAGDQRRALEVLTRTIKPEFLALPQSLANLLEPKNQNWFDSRYDREEFRSAAFPAFDELEAASVAAGLTFNVILNPERLARVQQFHGRDPSLPSVDDILESLTVNVFAPAPATSHLRLIQSEVAHRYVDALIALAKIAPPLLAAKVEAHLAGMEGSMSRPTGNPASAQRMLARKIRRFLERPAEAAAPSAEQPQTPPGSPIGSGHACDTCWFCDLPEQPL